MSKLAPLISCKLRHITVKLDEYVNDDMFNGVVNLLKQSQASLQVQFFRIGFFLMYYPSVRLKTCFL